MNKPQPQTGPEIEEYSTTATPKAYAGSVPVFCAHDAIVPLKDLRPNPKNPNQHPPEQIKLLASIIRATGWRAPITVSKRSGLVTKGHGRLMAAQLDDLTDAPVDYQDYASEAEELADLTADNRIAELATTDNKMLAEVFADIDTGEIPFMLSGYTEDDYGNIVTALSEALHTKEPSSDPDAEIPTPAAPVTPTQPAGLPFTDVPEGHWSYPYIKELYEAGVVSGTSATTFSPNAPVTRQDMATILYNYAKNVLDLDVFDTADLTGYPDYSSISDYARTPLSWAVAQGVILGVGNSNGVDTLQPKGDATRAQTATIIMRFCQNVL